jgi:FkbM family methyltransferase
MEAVNYRGVDLPFIRMGAVTSDDLFEPREQEVFDLYERKQTQYRRVVDVGANIGVHTVIMAKLGWEVRAFEPDPEHFKALREVVGRNGVGRSVFLYPYALSDFAGDSEFVRVLGNTTASHLAGSRSFHGEVERFTVRTIEGNAYFACADFAKIDVEGHEARLLCAVPEDFLCEFLVEIGSEENARAIYQHFAAQGRSMWRQVQGQGWVRVTSLRDMPTHYKHGSLFVGEQP